MISKGHFTRIDIVELKAFIYQKIGYERAEFYFNLLNRLFTAKISKSEFDKLCIRTVGREHLSLHNHFIRSIFKNASLSKVPARKSINLNGPLSAKLINRYQKKCRSRFNRISKFKDQPSPLGPLGKTRSPTVNQSPTELNSFGSRLHIVSVEDGEEVEQITTSSCVQGRSSIITPLGVLLNFGVGPRKKSIFKDPANDFLSMMCQSSGELPDAMSLQGQLERRLLSDGVGISEDCVNLLNNGLDVFLKRLIESGMGLAKSRFSFNRNLPESCMQRSFPSICMSLLDFRVSMESNPRILGADWPIQLEKVCSRVYEV